MKRQDQTCKISAVVVSEDFVVYQFIISLSKLPQIVCYLSFSAMHFNVIPAVQLKVIMCGENCRNRNKAHFGAVACAASRWSSEPTNLRAEAVATEDNQLA